MPNYEFSFRDLQGYSQLLDSEIWGQAAYHNFQALQELNFIPSVVLIKIYANHLFPGFLILYNRLKFQRSFNNY
jgi:hypothetical protein